MEVAMIAAVEEPFQVRLFNYAHQILILRSQGPARLQGGRMTINTLADASEWWLSNPAGNQHVSRYDR